MSYRRRYPTRESAVLRAPGRHSMLPPSLLRRIREYSADEPRDDHGRWTADGSLAALSTTDPSRDGNNQLTPSQVHQFDAAVQDAVARNPELVSGPHPLAGVGYATGPPPEGVSAESWQQLGAAIDDSQGLTYTMANDGKASAIMYNNEIAFGPTQLAAEATRTPYGAASHELGHAYWAEHGVLTADMGAPALASVGIGPNDVWTGLHSQYGASSAAEALAELYATAHTPGFSIGGQLGAAYSKLEANPEAWRSAPADSPIARQWSGALPRAGTRAERAALRAAAENLAANRWVADGSIHPKGVQ